MARARNRIELGGNMESKKRCGWVDGSDLYRSYHDNEWGIPVHEDKKLFEMLTLEAFQSGLMWITILKKREDFRCAFDGFEPQKVAEYDNEKIEELLLDEKIIRHRGKIVATINNAKLFLEIQKEYGSFDKFIWNFVGNKPIIGHYESLKDLPVTTEISDELSKELKKRGFKFLGSTTVYAFMQAIGMVNDHLQDCYLYGGNHFE